jgi:peroxiredoxin
MAGQPYTRRLNDLEQRFAQLAEAIPESPQKEAISVLHAMLQEVWRTVAQADQRSTADTALTLEDILNLHRKAPPMNGPAVSEPLAVGSAAPAFALRDANNEVVSLEEFRGNPLVLVFYPLDWSPTCSDQLSLYQSELEEFQRFDARLLAISVDSIYSHGAWAAIRGITFPLLADFEPKGEVARRYNVYRTGDGFSERALYVINAAGSIRYAHVSPRLDHIPDVYELFAALREITGTPADGPIGAAAAGHYGR